MGRNYIVLFFILCCGYVYPTPPIDFEDNTFYRNHFIPQQALEEADVFYHEQNYRQALNSYQIALTQASGDSATIYRRMALSAAGMGNAMEAVEHIENYFLIDFKPNFLLSEGFTLIQSTPEFKETLARYNPRLTVWSFVYLYVAFIGFYIAIVLNFNKKIDWVAKLLISSFVFIHSFFIFNICLLLTNYQFEFPHSYLMSTVFSFLYGPLLYFYFKRITQQYKFKKLDLLHLVPTVLFLFYIVPIYAMSAEEKLDLMLSRLVAGFNPGDSVDLTAIVVLKLLSLIIYGYFIRGLYRRSKQNKELRTENKIWQRNLYFIHVAYIITYAVYGTLISYNINTGPLFHFQIMSMALMVVYVGYSANVQPHLFSGLYSYDSQLLFKYKKSGLTESLSKELKEQLIYLFDEEKIYKESDISLELLASKLNTTRHNASQVINEHFNVSFHELINKYRIKEAKKILDSDYQKNLNIIDIAYEVGYNNKVTFNKAFKKDTQLTPSEYQKIFVKT